MRKLQSLVIYFALMTTITYGVYLSYPARLTLAGYCHAEEKYLTDEERIRGAIEGLLKKYPPPIIRIQVEPNVWRQSFPEHPVYYRDVDDFLTENHNCCKIESIEAFMEGGKLTIFELLTGTSTYIVDVNYRVKYMKKEQTEFIQTTERLRINNCGTPSKPWIP